MLPISEQIAYSFVLDHCGTSPSAPQSFREALMFLHGTLGADGAHEAASSPRIVGRCFAKMVTKAPLKQSRVLSTQEVVSWGNSSASLAMIPSTACLLGML